MPERGFPTSFWTEPAVRKLPPLAKLLLTYLGTNDHCNQAGLYQLDVETMAFETNIPCDELPALLKSLSSKIAWYPDLDIIWVRDFLSKQTKSSKFVVAAIKSLNSLSIPDDIRAEFYLLNQELLRGVAPSHHISLTKRECVAIRDNFICQYCGKDIQDSENYEMDHVLPIIRGGKDNYLNLVASCRSCNQKKFDRTPAEAGFKEPDPSPYHGAQAIYCLKNNGAVRQKWLEVFPSRQLVVHRIIGGDGLLLNNIEQSQSTLNNIGPTVAVDPLVCSTTASVSDSDSASKSVSVKEKGGSRGEEELAVISKLYEENIGQLTPIIAERLKFDADTYPAGWFREALEEALGAGVRKLKYIGAILERWQREGKKSPKKTATSAREDPDKYVKGQYGHTVCRTSGELDKRREAKEADQ